MSDRIKQLKLGHVFKIWNKTCPSYLTKNFSRLNENTDRCETRSYAYNFQIPRLSLTTFAYTVLKEWNCLSNEIKDINPLHHKPLSDITKTINRLFFAVLVEFAEKYKKKIVSDKLKKIKNEF